MMLDRTKPEAVASFTNTLDHPAIVEAAASRHIDVMMEKPLAISNADAQRIKRAADRGGVDVFVNLAGGVRVSEPAVDLGVALAVASAERRLPVQSRTAVFGEVGLAGEVRGVPHAGERVAEALKLGFERVVLPRHNRARIEAPRGIELVGVDHIEKAIKEVMPM